MAHADTSHDVLVVGGGVVGLGVAWRLGQRGARVAVLSDQEWPAGYHAVAWRADGVPSGLYLVQLRVGSFVRTQKILLVR